MINCYYISGANTLVIKANVLSSFPALKSELMKKDSSGIAARARFILLNNEPDSSFDGARNAGDFEKILQLATQMYLMNVDADKLLADLDSQLTGEQKKSVRALVKQSNVNLMNRDLVR